jgi:hypothetical protein
MSWFFVEIQRPFCHYDYLAEVAKAVIGFKCNIRRTGPSKDPELVFWELPGKRDSRRPKMMADLAAGFLGDTFALVELSRFLSFTNENAERLVLSEVRYHHVD